MVSWSDLRLDILPVHLALHLLLVLVVVVDWRVLGLVTNLIVEVVLSWLLLLINSIIIEFWSIVLLDCSKLLLIFIADLLPLGADLFILDQIETFSYGLDQEDLVSLICASQSLLDDVIAKIVTHKGMQSRRFTNFDDKLRSSLLISMLKTVLYHW